MNQPVRSLDIPSLRGKGQRRGIAGALRPSRVLSARRDVWLDRFHLHHLTARLPGRAHLFLINPMG